MKNIQYWKLSHFEKNLPISRIVFISLILFISNIVVAGHRNTLIHEDDLGNLEYIRSLFGATGGVQVLRNNITEEYFTLKVTNSIPHLQEEIIADALYQSLGVPVPQFQILTTLLPTLSEKGFLEKGLYRLSRFIQGNTLSGTQHQIAAKQLIKKHFVIDALLSNWDLHNENFIVTPEGVPVRIDNGGSLRFNAYSGLKTSSDNWDPNWVTDLSSMMDPYKYDKAPFGELPANEIKDQIYDLLKQQDSFFISLDDITSEVGLSEESRSELRQMLKSRFQYLALLVENEDSYLTTSWLPPSEKSAAGVLLHTQLNGKPHVLLARRTEKDTYLHNGNWTSLGGMSSITDSSLAQTAVRNAYDDSNGLIQLIPGQLEHVYSHDLIPTPFLSSFNDSQGRNEVKYRTYILETEYINPSDFRNAEKSFSQHAITDFEWVPLDALLNAVGKGTNKVMIKRADLEKALEEIELYQPFFDTLSQFPVQEALILIQNGQKVPFVHTQGTLTTNWKKFPKLSSR